MSGYAVTAWLHLLHFVDHCTLHRSVFKVGSTMNTSSQTAVQTPTYEAGVRRTSLFIEWSPSTRWWLMTVYSGYLFVIVHYFLMIEVSFQAIIFLPWSWEGLRCDEMPPVHKLGEWVHSGSIFAWNIQYFISGKLIKKKQFYPLRGAVTKGISYPEQPVLSSVPICENSASQASKPRSFLVPFCKNNVNILNILFEA